MQPVTEHDPMPRPPSPWSGSQHVTQHRWQLDGVRNLADASAALRALAAELTAAHEAGWALSEPMRNGHLLAARPSRRKRVQTAPPPRPVSAAAAPAIGWRLRVVDEPPVPGDEVLHLEEPAARRTSVVAWAGHALRQVGGPHLSMSLLDEATRQLALAPVDLGRRLWGVASARVGPSIDLVTDGSALRLHALHDGALLRTAEALTFQHAADRAATLRSAAAAYERLARGADAMADAGGRLVGVDDGLLHLAYGRG